MSKMLLIFFFIFLPNLNLHSSSLFMPDSDTGLLLALVGNTAEQLTRLEKLISETDKHTKLFRDSVEMVEERYEVVEQLQSMAQNYARIASEKPEDLSSLNDALEDLINQKDRVKEIVRKTRQASKESEQVKSDSRIVERKVESDNLVAKKQILKSFGSGKTFSRNMERINAQNTSLILKETISLNGSLNTTNGLLASQNNLSKIQVDQIAIDNASRENALKPIKKGKKR